MWKPECGPLSHPVYPSVQSSSLVKWSLQRASVLLEVPGFCYTINTEPLLRLLLDILIQCLFSTTILAYDGYIEIQSIINENFDYDSKIFEMFNIHEPFPPNSYL